MAADCWSASKGPFGLLLLLLLLPGALAFKRKEQSGGRAAVLKGEQPTA